MKAQYGKKITEVKTRSTKNVRPYQRWTTANIEAVLNDPYCRGVNGHDYEEKKEELQEELNIRLETKQEKEMGILDKLTATEKPKKDRFLHMRINEEQEKLLAALGGKSKGFDTLLEFFLANCEDSERMRLFNGEREKTVNMLLGE